MATDLRLDFRRHPVLAALRLAVALLAGTATLRAAQDPGAFTQDEARQMLRTELEEFDRYLDRSMQDAVTILKRRHASRDDVARLEAWERSERDRFRAALQQKDAVAALIDAWAVSESSVASLSNQTDTNALPPAVRDVALETLRLGNRRLVSMASSYLPADSVAKLSGRIAAYAGAAPAPRAGNPPAAETGDKSMLFSLWERGEDTVGSLLSLPLMPGRAMAGIWESGKALSGMRESTAQAVQLAGELPEKIRRELEIILDRVLAQRAEILELLREIKDASANLRETGTQAEDTARQVRLTLETAAGALPAAESLVVALERTARTSTELVRSVAALRPAGEGQAPGSGGTADTGFDVRQYQEAARSITDTAIELQRVMEDLIVLTESWTPRDRASPERPFDIREYRDTAVAIGCAAAEIRAAARELDARLTDPRGRQELERLSRQAVQAAAGAADEARAVIDHLALRLLQVALAAFLLALLYARLRKKKSER